MSATLAIPTSPGQSDAEAHLPDEDLMDSSGHPSSFTLIDDAELAAIRKGSQTVYLRVFRRWQAYVLSYRHYGRLLTTQDSEEIVQQAVAEVLTELDLIKNTSVTAKKLSECLGRALNRVRARYARKVVRIADDVGGGQKARFFGGEPRF